jgi:hypothetical protein
MMSTVATEMVSACDGIPLLAEASTTSTDAIALRGVARRSRRWTTSRTSTTPA